MPYSNADRLSLRTCCMLKVLIFFCANWPKTDCRHSMGKGTRFAAPLVLEADKAAKRNKAGAHIMRRWSTGNRRIQPCTIHNKEGTHLEQSVGQCRALLCRWSAGAEAAAASSLCKSSRAPKSASNGATMG